MRVFYSFIIVNRRVGPHVLLLFLPLWLLLQDAIVYRAKRLEVIIHAIVSSES